MRAAFIHHSFYPFMQTIARNKVQVSAYILNGHINSCRMIWWKRGNIQDKHAVRMVQAHVSRNRSQWVCEICLESEIHYLKYYFEITDCDNNTIYADEYGVSENPGNEQTAFELLQTHSENIVRVPEWAKGCVFYQIYPDSFSLPPEASETEKANWSSKPDKDHYLGGTLRGIKSRIPYLKDLGVGCLYLTPVFQADFTHRYATTDYMKIDPRLGTEQDLIDLTDALHENGIRIILDGVFNHCGVHFAPFEDVMKNGENSRYKDWFHIKKYPVTVDPSCYECVGDYPFMPRLNGACPEVREYVKSVLFYWLKTAHIDGWRFDVADELDENAVRFWLECVRRDYPEALMMAETWHPGTMAADGGSRFDCAMNYLFRDSMIDYFAHLAVVPSYYSYIESHDKEFAATKWLKKLEWLKDDTETVYDPDCDDVIRVAFMHQIKRARLSELVQLLTGRDFETREFKEEIEEQTFAQMYEGVSNVINEYNFKQFMQTIRSAGFISPKMVTSNMALDFAYALFLILQNSDEPVANRKRIVQRWYVLSILTQRYSASPESAFAKDLKVISEVGIAQALKNNLRLTRRISHIWQHKCPAVIIVCCHRISA